MGNQPKGPRPAFPGIRVRGGGDGGVEKGYFASRPLRIILDSTMPHVEETVM